MKFDLSNIELSKKDVVRKITFPAFLSTELAEFIGIMVGDGHLSYTRHLQGQMQSSVKIACNKNEVQYIEHVNKLFIFLFKTSLTPIVDKRSNTVVLTINSQGIVQFLHKVCGLILNKKTHIACIPTIIKDADEEMKCTFLRGLADTDFSVLFRKRLGKGHIYPVIAGQFRSKILV